MAFSPTAERLITGCVAWSGDAGSFAGLQSFDFKGSGETQYAFSDNPPHWTGLAVSPDGQFLVAAYSRAKSSAAAGVWNLQTGQFLCSLPAARVSAAINAAFTSDGERLVTSHYEGICVWSTKTWKLVSKIKGQGRMALSSDDRFIAYQNGKEVWVREFSKVV